VSSARIAPIAPSIAPDLLVNPYQVQSLAALAWACERSGNAALQRLACRQLILRAEEVDLASLLAERGALVDEGAVESFAASDPPAILKPPCPRPAPGW
jgi:hypothetical protein